MSEETSSREHSSQNKDGTTSSTRSESGTSKRTCKEDPLPVGHSSESGVSDGRREYRGGKHFSQDIHSESEVDHDKRSGKSEENRDDPADSLTKREKQRSGDVGASLCSIPERETEEREQVYTLLTEKNVATREHLPSREEDGGRTVSSASCYDDSVESSKSSTQSKGNAEHVFRTPLENVHENDQLKGDDDECQVISSGEDVELFIQKTAEDKKSLEEEQKKEEALAAVLLISSSPHTGSPQSEEYLDEGVGEAHKETKKKNSSPSDSSTCSSEVTQVVNDGGEQIRVAEFFLREAIRKQMEIEDKSFGKREEDDKAVEKELKRKARRLTKELEDVQKKEVAEKEEKERQKEEKERQKEEKERQKERENKRIVEKLKELKKKEDEEKHLQTERKKVEEENTRLAKLSEEKKAAKKRRSLERKKARVEEEEKKRKEAEAEEEEKKQKQIADQEVERRRSEERKKLTEELKILDEKQVQAEVERKKLEEGEEEEERKKGGKDHGRRRTLGIKRETYAPNTSIRKREEADESSSEGEQSVEGEVRAVSSSGESSGSESEEEEDEEEEEDDEEDEEEEDDEAQHGGKGKRRGQGKVKKVDSQEEDEEAKDGGKNKRSGKGKVQKSDSQDEEKEEHGGKGKGRGKGKGHIEKKDFIVDGDNWAESDSDSRSPRQTGGKVGPPPQGGARPKTGKKYTNPGEEVKNPPGEPEILKDVSTDLHFPIKTIFFWLNGFVTILFVNSVRLGYPRRN